MELIYTPEIIRSIAFSLKYTCTQRFISQNILELCEESGETGGHVLGSFFSIRIRVDLFTSWEFGEKFLLIVEPEICSMNFNKIFILTK